MTSCASALVCLHFIQSCGTTAPVIVLTGEKAFHPSVARLTVGLLAEVPVAAVLNGGPGSWRVRATDVRHLPRFHINPEAMDAHDRSALQEVYAPELTRFIAGFLEQHAAALDPELVFVPHNLNRPLTDALIREFGWEEQHHAGDVTQIDLPGGRMSGMVDALEVLANIDDIAVVRFSEVDVVRHPLVAKIITAYERAAKRR